MKARAIHSTLLKVYGKPEWEKSLTVMDELILTILSQNTNDRNRDIAYQALREKFKTWADVRDASLDEVVASIQFAGLANQKAARIQTLLKQITEERGDLNLGFLRDEPIEEVREWLMGFKGVGPKTAAIVLLFSLGKPAFPVDTHIYRVTGRLGLRPSKLDREKTHVFLEQLFQPDMYAPLHLNLIRLGREICHPAKPECPRCPVSVFCDYYQSLRTQERMQ